MVENFSESLARDNSPNLSPNGIYIDTILGSAANTVFPAEAGIQGTLQLGYVLP